MYQIIMALSYCFLELPKTIVNETSTSIIAFVDDTTHRIHQIIDDPEIMDNFAFVLSELFWHIQKCFYIALEFAMWDSFYFFNPLLFFAMSVWILVRGLTIFLCSVTVIVACAFDEVLGIKIMQGCDQVRFSMTISTHLQQLNVDIISLLMFYVFRTLLINWICRLSEMYDKVFFLHRKQMAILCKAVMFLYRKGAILPGFFLHLYRIHVLPRAYLPFPFNYIKNVSIFISYLYNQTLLFVVMRRHIVHPVVELYNKIRLIVDLE